MPNLLRQQGIKPKTVNMIEAARVLATFLTDPETRLDVDHLSRRSGLTEREIVDMLNSPEWHDLIRAQISSRTGTYLSAGIDVLNEIVHDPDSNAQHRIAAFRAMAQVYKDAVDLVAKQDGDSAARDAAELLKKLKPAKAIVVEHESKERACADSDSGAGGQEQGGSPAAGEHVPEV